MKNNILILACISTAIAHGMEEPKEFSIISYGTKVSVIQDLLSNRGNKVNLAVVGQNSPKLVSNSTALHVGKIKTRKHQIFYEQDKNDKFKFNRKKMPCMLISTLEPNLYETNFFSAKTQKEEPCYFYDFKAHDPASNSLKNYTLDGYEAIEKALTELTFCYSQSLTIGLNLLPKKKEKSIAFQALGFSFPQKKTAKIAIDTILEFVKHHPSAYDRIELIVREQSDFILYTKPLALMKTIRFLYWACKNHDNFFSHTPREIIDSITLIMLNS